MIPRGVAYTLAVDFGAAGLTVSAQVSRNGAPLAPLAGVIADNADGTYQIPLSIAEMTAALVMVRASAPGYRPQDFYLQTEEHYTPALAGEMDALHSLVDVLLSSRAGSQELADALATITGLIDGLDIPPDDTETLRLIQDALLTIYETVIATETEADAAARYANLLVNIQQRATSADVSDAQSAIIAALPSAPPSAEEIALAVGAASPTDVTEARDAVIAAMPVAPTAEEIAAEVGAATPENVAAGTAEVITALPAEPPSADDIASAVNAASPANVTAARDAVIAALGIHVSIPATSTDVAQAIPIVRNADYTGVRGIPVTVSVLPTGARKYRLTIRRTVTDTRYHTAEIVPVGNVFTLEFIAPDAPGGYSWDIEPRDEHDNSLPTLVSGTLTVINDVTRPTDWTNETE